ncbi:hypothetical protein LCGC14_1207180 [marine sediment metagenome]|uniref:Uncharacterized protein n=1 Tax=marine sediment metagenome TaxID=412755 RepID=A0A0F9LF20_9ZZZZ
MGSKDFTDELELEKMRVIRDETIKRAEVVLNPLWKRAYLNLADAADRIVAMSVRTMGYNSQ